MPPGVPVGVPGLSLQSGLITLLSGVVSIPGLAGMALKRSVGFQRLFVWPGTLSGVLGVPSELLVIGGI